ncbi:39S ribosomal protein L30, mitochondrial [Lampris incognitus]|uniref:39S ribosomal protein L30, mitochondrial n=1 Tax=Lampris incognitus TaxID=2546036 RepID=UPI0024B54B82|nr:39S ribosomal protein L30, mitochondrial [Lampris incognitus]
MSIICRGCNSASLTILTGARLQQSPWLISLRSKFTRSRIPKEHFEKRSKQHDKYGGDPDQPHKLHIVTRVKSAIRRPYWEKEMVKNLGLEKAHVPVIHKNTQSVNSLLKIVKHLIRVQPLKTPYGIPAEEDLANSYINSKGELIVCRLLKPKAIES